MQKHEMQLMVEEFMLKFGNEVNSYNKNELMIKKLADFSDKTNNLRFNILIREEFGELTNAIADNDIIEIADAIGDSLYVVLGAFATYGIIYEQSETNDLHTLSNGENKDVIMNMLGNYNFILTLLEDSNSYGLINLVDLNDYLYALMSTLFIINAQYGINIMDIFKEIHESNLSKLDINGNPIYNEVGKIMKGSNFFKPNIAKYIK